MSQDREVALKKDDGESVDAALGRVWALHEAGRHQEALIGCIDIEYRYPNARDLQELRSVVTEAYLAEHYENAYQNAGLGQEKLILDALEARAVPDSFKAIRHVEKQDTSTLSEGSPMADALNTPVTMHLQDADLATIINALSVDTNVNVIADQDVGDDKRINIQADEVPLRELLDYIGRNMGIDFEAGKNVLWISNAKEDRSPPLHTRIFHLNKGMQWHGGDWGAPATNQDGLSDLHALSFKAATVSTNKTYLEEIIERFTTATEGAQLYLDRNTHALFVKNTWDNLNTIEALVEAVDISPPQVFIEARFIEVGVADLRELGLEWILDSPWATTSETIMEDGQPVNRPRTQIREDNILQYTPFTSDGGGTTPLGPQGVFGAKREGTPPTADQGLNLTYQGILTQPMFSAVLHALDISGMGRTLSVPRVTTINNNPAKLRHGQDLRYFDQFKSQAFSLLDENRKAFTVTVLIPEGKPSIEELGITLVAVPSVGADRETIDLMLTPTISELEGFLSYQDVDRTNDVNDIQQVTVKLPIINRREIQTKVVVRSGDTVVMGGLIETVEQETLHKVPLLGDIPVAGKLFQRVDSTEQTKNLLVFVTATILSERGEGLVPKPGAKPFPGTQGATIRQEENPPPTEKF